MLRCEQFVWFKHVSIIVLMFFNVLSVINIGSGGRFGEFVGSSKNDSKSIAICPGALISHLGIIKTQQIPMENH